MSIFTTAAKLALTITRHCYSFSGLRALARVDHLNDSALHALHYVKMQQQVFTYGSIFIYFIF
jgi:hypothetical protein